MTNVLLIDDDQALSSMQARYLSAEGFEVECAYEGEKGAEFALNHPIDIIVLDVMMPNISGFDVLRKIRQHSNVPVIMLTAKGDDVDRVVGLELGADDYVPKPCTPRELVARIKAILRRVQHQEQPTANLEVGALVIRSEQRLAEWAGQALDLTGAEFSLLEVFARNAGRMLSKQDLCKKALGRPLARYDRSIDVHVSNLRQKLGQLADGRSPIQTVRGMGYQFITE